MITLEAYWKHRDEEFENECTGEIRANAQVTVDKANELLVRAGRSDIHTVNSGWRPLAVNDATANSGKQSRHITAEAVDIADPDRQLAAWCLDNLDVLDELGLWMEDPRWTPTWVHVQTQPPKSEKRVYVPSAKPPLVPPPQRGSILVYTLVALAGLTLLTGIGYKIRESGKDAIRLEWAEANRKEEARKEREREARNTITEKREAENATAYADLDARYRAALLGLRKPAGDNQAKPLSQAASLIACPDRQADVAGRLERFEAGALGLLERGDKAIARTITCKVWLDDQLKVKVE